MHISDWSSDVCSSDLAIAFGDGLAAQLSHAGEQAVVGAEFRGQQGETVDLASCQLGKPRQLFVHSGYVVRKQASYRLARGQVGMARIGDLVLVSPGTDGRDIDIDQRDRKSTRR